MGCVVSITPRPRFTPGKGLSTGQEAGWAPEPVWTQRLEKKILCLCRGSNPGHPVHTRILYWPSYPAPIQWLFSAEKRGGGWNWVFLRSRGLTRKNVIFLWRNLAEKVDLEFQACNIKIYPKETIYGCAYFNQMACIGSTVGTLSAINQLDVQMIRHVSWILHFNVFNYAQWDFIALDITLRWKRPVAFKVTVIPKIQTVSNKRTHNKAWESEGKVWVFANVAPHSEMLETVEEIDQLLRILLLSGAHIYWIYWLTWLECQHTDKFIWWCSRNIEATYVRINCKRN
jgi:hypothetical protein